MTRKLRTILLGSMLILLAVVGLFVLSIYASWKHVAYQVDCMTVQYRDFAVWLRPIEGRVIDAGDGHAIAGATIVIELHPDEFCRGGNNYFESQQQVLTSDEAGRFSGGDIQYARVDSFTLRISADGCTPLIREHQQMPRPPNKTFALECSE